jgi:hypothetical protein
MSIILSLVGSRMSDDSLTREGYRQVVRISGKDLVRIFGTRSWDVTADGQRFLTTVPQVQRVAPASISVILNWPSLLKK